MVKCPKCGTKTMKPSKVCRLGFVSYIEEYICEKCNHRFVIADK